VRKLLVCYKVVVGGTEQSTICAKWRNTRQSSYTCGALVHLVASFARQIGIFRAHDVLAAFVLASKNIGGAWQIVTS
jgi:hypothetical protein